LTPVSFIGLQPNAGQSKMKWRILIRDNVAIEAKTVLQPQAEVVTDGDLESIGQYQALIVRSATKVNADLLQRASRLQVIGRAGVGVDNIDLEAARERGIIVVNAPEAASQAVAEHALGLMLALARRIPAADASIRSGAWEKRNFKGVELNGKVLGILGVGRIGALLAKKARALGMQCVGFDALLSHDEIQSREVRPVLLDELLAQSDYVSLHVPLSDDTRGMMNADALALMKHGAYLISTARGGVVDEGALLQALNAGQLAGAALDVFEHEPPQQSALVSHPAVVSTPHIAAQTEEAQRRAALEVAEEVLSALQGKPLRWRVI
jgi:D-3-phosphoglycerate dehydrogenase